MKTEEEAKNYSKNFVCNVDIKGTLHPQTYMKSDMAIDDETRHKLLKKE